MRYSYDCPRCACSRPIARFATDAVRCLVCDFEFTPYSRASEISEEEWQAAYSERYAKQAAAAIEAKAAEVASVVETKTEAPEVMPITVSPALDLARNPTGGVYLIKSGQHFKIGKANDFDQRIKQVKLQLPEKAAEIHRIYTDDPIGIESYWHKRFKEKRKNGEWFELTEEDVDVFKARTRM